LPLSRRAPHESDLSPHGFIYTIFSRRDFSDPFSLLFPAFLRSDISLFSDFMIALHGLDPVPISVCLGSNFCHIFPHFFVKWGNFSHIFRAPSPDLIF